MAAGLPVITTNVGGNPELVTNGRTGLLVPTRDAGALARSMMQLIESPDLTRSLGNAAHVEVAQRFSIESVTRQMEDLYSELADKRRLKKCA
jgi:glycosyltransferase involved in cell wall biosynthesis